MQFNDYQRCIEHAAMCMMQGAGDGAWDRAELRLMWLDDDVTQGQALRVTGNKAESIRVDTVSWILALRELLTPGKTPFTKMSLVVTRDGRFDARYAYDPIPEDADEMFDLDELPPNFWP